MDHATDPRHRRQTGLPAPLDCETLALLHGFLAPILETATSWQDLADRLRRKGYGLTFRLGHLVILGEGGNPLCTGKSVGVPLRDLSLRLGRPCIRAESNGRAGHLH